MLEARPLRTQGSDAAGAAGGAGAALRDGSAPILGPNAGSLGSMGERSAYQRLTGSEEGQQVMEEAWGIIKYPGRSPHYLLVS